MVICCCFACITCVLDLVCLRFYLLGGLGVFACGCLRYVIWGCWFLYCVVVNVCVYFCSYLLFGRCCGC